MIGWPGLRCHARHRRADWTVPWRRRHGRDAARGRWTQLGGRRAADNQRALGARGVVATDSLSDPPSRRRTFLSVQFSKELRDDVAGGDITVTFRLWRRPQVKVGGRYRVGRSEIAVDSMEQVPFARISDADVCGRASTTASRLRARAAHAGPIADETLLYRIAFHVVG